MRLKVYLTFLFFLSTCFLISKLNAQQLQTKTLTQINALLNEKNSRTQAEQKISSGLLQAVREKQNLAMVQGVQLKKANVNADAQGNVMVDINANVTNDLLSKIESKGGKIIFPSFRFHTIRAILNLAEIKEIAGYPDIKFIKAAEKMKLVDLNKNTTAPTDQINTVKEKNIRRQLVNYLQSKSLHNLNSVAISGPVISQGDRDHRADDVRNIYGYEGDGIKIGVLSDSYNSKKDTAEDILNGQLPGIANPFGYNKPVTVVQESSGNDEGRAMLHIVHDLAPGATLFFATANGGESNFANNILTLRDTFKCDIIIDDVEYLQEAPFQDGTVAQAVNTVTEEGALYFSSAGNQGSLLKNTSAVYEGDFNDKGSPVFIDSTENKHGSVHNFGSTLKPVNGDSVLNGSTDGYFSLEWTDPLGKSSNDYDLFMVDSSGNIVASSTDIQNGSQDPEENLSADYQIGDKLVVFKDSTASVRAFRLNAAYSSDGDKGLVVATNGQTHGHSSALNAFAVAATPALVPFSSTTVTGPYPNAFNNTNQVESFSSDGPRHIFYNADTTPVTPGNFLFATNGGVKRIKPDVTAADGVYTNTGNTTFFDPFYGTSAAAPHAGAIAALLKSANPALTTAAIRSLLTSTALDIEASGTDELSGYGILQAFQAMQKLNPAAFAVINIDTVYAVDGNNSNHNGYLEPGETGNLFIGLNDTSLKPATSVSAIISTSDSTVTILNDSAYYGTINTNGVTVLNSNPFILKIDSAHNCGDTIFLKVTVRYSGGVTATKTFETYIYLGSQPYKNIVAHLGTPKSGTGYTISTGQQTGRLGRFTVTGSTCDSLSANPGLNISAGAGLRTYDAYVFTNATSNSQCVTVLLSANSNSYDSIYTVVYNDSGFVSSSPATHFLAEPLNTGTDVPFSFSFNAASGKSFTVVVNAIYASTFVGAPYTLSVSLAQCAQSVLAVDIFNLIAEADQVKQQIPLQWTILNDQQIRFYEVLHSTDGINFSNLSIIQSALSSTKKTYSYLDKAPSYGDNYYRIKKVDVNGKISYSNIVKAVINFSADIMLMPNPASSYLNIFSKTSMSEVQLFGSKGQLLQTIKPQSNYYKLTISNLAAGEYFIRVQANNTVINKKFIKQ